MSRGNLGITTGLEYPHTAQPSADYRLPASDEGVPLGTLDGGQNLDYFFNPDLCYADTFHQPRQHQPASSINLQRVIRQQQVSTATRFRGDADTVPHHPSQPQSPYPWQWHPNQELHAFQGGQIDAIDQRVSAGSPLQNSNGTVDGFDSFHHGHFPVPNVPNNLSSSSRENAHVPPKACDLCALAHEIHTNDDYFKRPVDPETTAHSFEKEDEIVLQPVEIGQFSNASSPTSDLRHVNVSLPPLTSRHDHTPLQGSSRDIGRLSDDTERAFSPPRPALDFGGFLRPPAPINTGTNQPITHPQDHLPIASNESTASIPASEQTCNLPYGSAHLQPDSNGVLASLRNFVASSAWNASSPNQFSNSSSVSHGYGSPPRTASSDGTTNFSTSSYQPPPPENPSPLPITLENHALTSYLPLTRPQSSPGSLLSSMADSNRSVQGGSRSTIDSLRSSNAEFNRSTNPSIKITRKVRGRRPLVSSQIGLSSDQTPSWSNTHSRPVPGGRVVDPDKHFELDPRLVSYCQSTNTCKFHKIFICQVQDCGKCFRRHEHLKRHVGSIHTTDRPFRCPWPTCPRSFNRRDNLKQHIRVHGRK